jgi:hypothetical protein
MGMLFKEDLGHVSGELATWREMWPVLRPIGHLRMTPASGPNRRGALASRDERATVSLSPEKIESY